jgi:XTP/dITP diphosphohydrolase
LSSPLLVIATHNVKKAGEMATILSRRFPDLEIKTLADYPGAPEPEETGETYAENAAIKAESAAAFTGELCVADDAGLEIDALDGAPGHKSKRFGGEDLPFPEKMAMILDLLRGVPEERRTARFRCCVAVAEGKVEGRRAKVEGTEGKVEGTKGQRDKGTEGADSSFVIRHSSFPSTPNPRPSTLLFTAACEGRIADAPSGSGGFGYDPIFFLPELGCCMADLTPDQKHAISHRGKVLKLAGDWLERRIADRG